MLCIKCGEKNRRKESFCVSCGTVLKYPCSNGGGETSTGMAENTASMVAYIGWWLTGLFFYFSETKSKIVKFHAMQSILAFAPVTVLNIILGIIRGAISEPWFYLGRWAGYAGVGGGAFTLWRILGWITTIVWIGAAALTVFLILKANQGEQYKLPIVGAIAAKQLD